MTSVQKSGYKRLVTLDVTEVFRGGPPAEVIFDDPETDCGVKWGGDFTTSVRLMRAYPVSTRINHVANDDEECPRPVEVAETQNRLFS